MKDGKGALSGIRVVDLTRILAGPFCTQMLGDHGAEIVKIEALEGDETRRWGPPFSEDGMSAYFLGVNRNKRSIAINLATQVGREILCNLLMKADVLIENLLLQGFGVGGNDDFFIMLHRPQGRRNEIGETLTRSGASFNHQMMTLIEGPGNSLGHFQLLRTKFKSIHGALDRSARA